MSDTFYNVVYSKMGKIIKEPFPTLDKAIEDFKEKRRLDILEYFDDRFVIGIEDCKGVKIDISNIDLENEKNE